MVFSSLLFLFIFLPCVLLIYYLTPSKCRNLTLFIASLLFYAWGEPVYVLLMLFSILVNYSHGLLIDKYSEKKEIARYFLLSSILFNVGMLIFFKYVDFFILSFNNLMGTSIDALGFPLPIGISFYTFQSMSYTIDVYRHEIPVQRNIITFGTYVSLFPQLIAGPIVRYQTIGAQLDSRNETFDSFAEGIRRFLAGLGKKVLLANNIGLLWHQIRLIEPTELTVLTAWLGIIAFTFQIYFDFSGYSDMAIGLGKMFGFTFPENFNYPYISKSITEFWKRWHISLGTWFRKYVYIPLGGNRTGKLNLYRNLLIVWFLTGFWHGASWNYILWGLYFCIIIVLEKAILLKWLCAMPPFIGHLYAGFLIVIGWVLFAFENIYTGRQYLQVMFGLRGTGFYNEQSVYFLYTHALLFLILIVGSTPLLGNTIQKLKCKSMVLYYTTILFLSIAYLVDSIYNPFLYFRF
ncbi:MAG: MBOAT family protein [Eubacteriales bacterium]|nr:MBOAT family protein [Eubacteriales bacterium]